MNIYDSLGALIKNTTYEYTEKESYTILGLKVYKASFEPDVEFDFLSTDDFISRPLEDRVYFYDNKSKWWVQSKKTETDYLNNGTKSVITEQVDQYDNPIHKMITSTQVVNSDLTKKTIRFKYPLDYNSTEPYYTMVSRNILAPIILQSEYKNDDIVPYKETKTDYGFWLNDSWSSNSDSSIALPKSIKVKIGGNDFEPRINFDSYNKYGQLTSYTESGGPTTSFLWGSNGQYPVGKIIGAKFNEISSLIQQPILDNPITQDSTLRNELDKVRKAFKSDHNVQVWSYTYKPLVGMTSETDPKGITTYYEYDPYGILELMKDLNGKTLKKIN